MHVHSTIQKRSPIMKLTDVKNQMKMFEYLKLKDMHHKVIVIQVRVYNVIFLVLHFRLGVYINQRPGM